LNGELNKNKNKIRLLVIEDNRILREGIISILRTHSDIKIIAESEKSEKTILKIHELKPDVILLDLGLRSHNSLGLVEMVREEFPESKVIIMDLVPVQSDIHQFVLAGASGFILKDATLEEFLMTIRNVAEGLKVLPSNMNNSLFTQIIEYAIKNGKAKLMNAVKMTKREKEILIFAGDGLSNINIAKKLNITKYSVKSHMHNILEKLALRTRLETSQNKSGLGILKVFSENISLINKR
jgi:DNA-binding NarL/FixJ family response regulator